MRQHFHYSLIFQLSAKELVNSSPNTMTLGIPTPQAAHHSQLHTHCSFMHSECVIQYSECLPPLPYTSRARNVMLLRSECFLLHNNNRM